MRSHIGWRGELWSRRGVDCEIPHWLERGAMVPKEGGL